MLVVTRSNLAQSFSGIAGKSGKVSDASKRVAQNLSGVSAGQALYHGLTGPKMARDILSRAIESYSVETLCARETVDYGSLFVVLSFQFGVPTTTGSRGRDACIALVKNEIDAIRIERRNGDQDGYKKGETDKIRAREDVMTTVFEALDRWEAKKVVDMAARAAQTVTVTA